MLGIRPHSAHLKTAWLQSKGVWVLDWPACNPDLTTPHGKQVAHSEGHNTTTETTDG